MIIASTSDQAKPTAPDPVDSRSRVALPEKQFARSEHADSTINFKPRNSPADRLLAATQLGPSTLTPCLHSLKPAARAQHNPHDSSMDRPDLIQIIGRLGDEYII
jgi:hypothetical protein